MNFVEVVAVVGVVLVVTEFGVPAAEQQSCFLSYVAWVAMADLRVDLAAVGLAQQLIFAGGLVWMADLAPLLVLEAAFLEGLAKITIKIELSFS